ncbi:GNAT family protein [Xinfangfangia sp. CPCC 101601]|uniref:GNAT family protein n=1 Tax=Pseudogemmobacter lacusdianii TaxID=3069608 RepID=A0ABU0VV50_9RHOB|nr:GNAT family protein [Xinfangfangia sp. CPCC 101601]MDQ2065528.1 GNAT family protein [Xinfangfangia sp. CPCC 101601]
MGLRPATAADFDFIRSLTTHPDYTPFIGDADEGQLAVWAASPACRILIWQDGPAKGFAIFREIGDPSGRVELFRLALTPAGGGAGKAFFAALIDYGFNTLNAARIWLDASGENPRAIKLYSAAGFQLEGVMRQHWYRPALGHAVDLHLMGLMRSEWLAQGAA